MTDTIKMDTNAWSTSSNSTQTGSTNSDDLVNAVMTTINSLIGALNTVSFLNNIQNFATALDDFGYGMNAALACIGLDLQVVASGLGAAAAAFGSLDAALAKTFGDLET